MSPGADNSQLTDHERRPEGPSKADGCVGTAGEAAVKTSMVAALDLPGQVPHPSVLRLRGGLLALLAVMHCLMHRHAFSSCHITIHSVIYFFPSYYSP